MQSFSTVNIAECLVTWKGAQRYSLCSECSQLVAGIQLTNHMHTNKSQVNGCYSELIFFCKVMIQTENPQGLLSWSFPFPLCPLSILIKKDSLEKICYSSYKLFFMYITSIPFPSLNSLSKQESWHSRNLVISSILYR